MKTRLKEVWITKYALTTGILHTTHAYEDKGYIVVCDPGALNNWSMFNKNDAHKSLEEALAKVVKMKAAKRKSIEKQLKALDKEAPVVEIKAYPEVEANFHRRRNEHE